MLIQADSTKGNVILDITLLQTKKISRQILKLVES